MDSALHIFLLALAAIFPIGLTSSATNEVRRLVAWRVARNAFFVLVSALLLGSLILSLYGISIPVLRVAGGFIVAVAGWKLVSEDSQKELEATADATTTRPIHLTSLSTR